jgi:glutamate-5-semialdehyde dehydrogenase
MTPKEIVQKIKIHSRKIQSLRTDIKNRILLEISESLIKNTDAIISENSKDITIAKEKNLSSAMIDRLVLDSKRIKNLAKSVEEVATLQDPVGEVIRGGRLPNGLKMFQERVPLGVLMVIYESRPNVTIDVASLAFKSGNAILLKGGREAFHSNLFLSNLFKAVLKNNSLPEDLVYFISSTERESILPYLELNGLIDIVVPRGGEGLIQYVSENTRIPVVKHDKGVCNLFVDESANPEMVLPIVMNSKLQRPGVCNALENLIIHKNYRNKNILIQELIDEGAEIIIDPLLKNDFPNCKLADEDEYSTEFLDNRLSVKIVDSLEDAMDFIQLYSSGHTEAILSNHEKNIETFVKELDSAAVFVNCSTRFHDGGELGFGAEVGISTGKLHVRGPMGLSHLTTTKTILIGEGQLRS